MRIVGLLLLAAGLVLGHPAGASSETAKASDTKANAAPDATAAKAKPTRAKQPGAEGTRASESAAKQDTAATRNADAARKFETFCGSWLDKLRERERFNRTKIEWRKAASGVVGEYVGYDTDKYRVLPPADVQQSPVGKLVYMELRLRVSGDSEDQALKSGPQIIEQTEVTELFRYDRGAWVY